MIDSSNLPWTERFAQALPHCPICEQPAPVWPSRACGACQQPYLLRERFLLLSPLGGGAQGQVWGAWDQGAEPPGPVALKQLSLSQAREWKKVELFERQSRVIQALQHAGVPRWVDAFEVRRPGLVHFYLAQELIDGETLAEELAHHNRRYTEPELRDVARQALEILAYLHGHSPPIIHRDIKPSNLMRRRADGSLVLIDFGLVRDLALPDAGSTMGAGTHGYAPPEQYAGHATPATDLYALGATLIALASRCQPGDLVAPGTWQMSFAGRVAVSPPFCSLLERLVQPDPAARPRSAAEVLAELDAPVRAGSAHPHDLPDVLQQGGRDQPKLNWITWLLVGLVLLGAALANRWPTLDREVAAPAKAAIAKPKVPVEPALFKFSLGNRPRVLHRAGQDLVAARVTYRQELATDDQEFIAVYRGTPLAEVFRTPPLSTKNRWEQHFALVGDRLMVVEPPAKLRFFDLADGKPAGEWKAPDRVRSLCVSGDAQTLYVETEGVTWLRLDGKGAASPAPKLPAECPRFFGNGGFMPGQSPCHSTDYRGNRLPYTPPSPADDVHIRDFSAGVCATNGPLGLLLGRSDGAGSQYAALAAVDLAHPDKPLWRLDLVERTPEFSLKGEPGVGIVAGRGIVYFVQGKTAFLQAYDLNSGQLLWSQPMPLSCRMFTSPVAIYVEIRSERLEVRSPQDGKQLGTQLGR